MKKTNSMKRVLLIILIIAAFIVQLKPNIVKAEDYWPSGPEVPSPCVIVMEVNSGAILYEKNSHEVHYPASITKIMTTLLAIEYCDMDEIVTFSEDAVFKNEGDTSHIARDLGEEMTMEQCLYAVMLESANECAYAVAEHVGKKLGGDYQTFIDLMNERAIELGCLNTHFNNANGLPDEEHYTTAYDMALISQAAYRNEAFRIITGTKSYTIPITNKHDTTTPLHNHHKMLYPYQSSKYLYDYCTGGKTGYTRAAKSTLVTFAEKDGMSLVCVVMYSDTPDHFKDTKTLLNHTFDSFQVLSIAQNETSLGTEGEQEKGELNSSHSFVTLDENAYIILPKTVDFSAATYELIEGDGESDPIATLQYTYAGHVVGSVDIVKSNIEVDNGLFEQTSDEEEDGMRTVIIKPVYIFVLVLVLIAFVLMIIGIKRLYDNWYIIKHRIMRRKKRKQRFRENKKEMRRRRKQSIIFKSKRRQGKRK